MSVVQRALITIPSCAVVALSDKSTPGYGFGLDRVVFDVLHATLQLKCTGGQICGPCVPQYQHGLTRTCKGGGCTPRRYQISKSLIRRREQRIVDRVRNRIVK